MKKILLLVAAVALIAAWVHAQEISQTNNGWATYRLNPDCKSATFTVTADATGDVTTFEFLKPHEIYGWHLHSVEAYSANDDAFTVLLTTANGTSLLSFALTQATTGEATIPSAYWPITSNPVMDVTGLGSASGCTVITTFTRAP